MSFLEMVLEIEVGANEEGSVVITARAKNVSGAEMTLQSASSQVFRVRVKDGRDVVWSPGVMYTQDVSSFTVDDGGVLERSFEWPLPEVVNERMPDHLDEGDEPDPREYDEVVIEAELRAMPKKFGSVVSMDTDGYINASVSKSVEPPV